MIFLTIYLYGGIINMYVDNVNKNNTNYAISAFNNVLICSNAINDDKTITFPVGYNLDSNLSFNVVFVNGHNCEDANTPLTLNDILVVSNKNGTLIPLPIHQMTESGSTVYKSLQANTILNLYYTSNYDGANTPAFVIIGNPIVLSDTDYVIYADGYYKWLSFGTTERWTGKYYSDGKPIYCKVWLGNSGTADIDITDFFSDVDKYTSINGIIDSDTPYGISSRSMYYGSSTDYFWVHIWTNNGFRLKVAHVQNQNRPCRIFFEYTKTTDSAGTIPPFSN